MLPVWNINANIYTFSTLFLLRDRPLRQKLETTLHTFTTVHHTAVHNIIASGKHNNIT
jgi:hypothetical protein